jgi:hypothetical protein
MVLVISQRPGLRLAWAEAKPAMKKKEHAMTTEARVLRMNSPRGFGKRPQEGEQAAEKVVFF